MVKESETVVKKRRKASVNSAESKTASSEDIYKRVVNYEEAESKLRSPESDAKLFRKTCNDIRNILSEISELKKENTEDAENEIAEKRIQASMHFVVLKKLNRMEKYRTKAGRDMLHKEKQNVDSTQLQLQNLFYESDHLIKEVTKCLQFKSKDEEIDLVPKEEFFENAPTSITKDITVNDPHRLQLARLEYELLQRKELARLCKELQGTKGKIADDIVAKKTQLDSLGPKLKTMLEATKPLQEALGLPIDKEKQMQARAKLLPEPLYLLYVNIYSYMQACDKYITVSINGDDDDAKQYKLTRDICGNIVDSDSENELEQESIDDSLTKKRHHRKISKEDRLEQKRKELLKPHPLSVVIVISTKDASYITLSFSYLKMLHIVTVKCDVESNEKVTGVSAGDLISPLCFLNCLYQNDNGEASPNLTNEYKLNKLGMGELLPLLGDLGRPYIWAQRLCGLDFLLMDLQKEPRYDISQTVVQSTVKALRNRLISRIALCKQIQKLETGSLYPIGETDMVPVQYNGILTSWTSISWSEYCDSHSTKLHVQDQTVNSNDMFYRAIITRASAKLVCLIAVGSDYPKSYPILSVTVIWNGEFNATNCDAIRDMERAINCDWDDHSSTPRYNSYCLTLQLMRMFSCFDIYLETQGSSEFPTDKTFFKFLRGRNRFRPYKFVAKAGGIFTHY